MRAARATVVKVVVNLQFVPYARDANFASRVTVREIAEIYKHNVCEVPFDVPAKETKLYTR